MTTYPAPNAQRPAPMTTPAKPAQPVAPRPAAAPQAQPAPAAPKPEAQPITGGALTIDFIDAEGWPMSLTLTATSGLQAIDAGRTAVKRLKDLGMKPKASPEVKMSSMWKTAQGDQPEADAPICAIHNKPMTMVKGRKGFFWSCHERLPDGTFCPYKPNPNR